MAAAAVTLPLPLHRTIGRLGERDERHHHEVRQGGREAEGRGGLYTRPRLLPRP